jgi:adenosylcobinamide-GDP ribazoletransferase
MAGGAGGVELAAALGTALALGLVGGWPGLLALVLALAVAGGFLAYMVRRVGGYTGDGLGAMAQLGEIVVLVVLAGAWA